MSPEGFDSASVLKLLRSKLASRNATVVVAEDMSKEELLTVMEKVRRRMGRFASGSACPPSPLASLSSLSCYARPNGQAKVVFDSCMRGSERVIAEASLLGALPLTDACQTGANFADVPIPTVVPMAHKRGDEVAYATSLYGQVAKMMDGYWDLLPSYAPYRQRYYGLNAATLHEDMATFLHSISGPNHQPRPHSAVRWGNGSALMGRGRGVRPCVGC